MTTFAGVVGNPIGHSLSPAIHRAWIEAAGLDAEYRGFCVDPGDFPRFVDEQRWKLRGLNVTIPFKEEALAGAHERSELAAYAAAANLLVFEEGRIVAHNTDGPGLLAALKAEAGFEPTDGPAVILGAGGAARGAAAALLLAGSPEVRIVNRTVERADALCRSLGSCAVNTPSAEEAFEGAAVIINATSLGLGGGEGPQAPFECAPGEAVVMDMVYRPLVTGFLDAAARRGHPTVDGLEMLIGQARPSFEAFFGVPPPDIDVRAVALEAMR